VTVHNATIVRAAAITAALTAVGSFLGLLRDLLLARWFGATGSTDAFLVAWTVPETASPLLIEGAMALVMIPIFVRATAGGASLAGVVRTTLPRLAAPLILLSAGVMVGAPWLVHVLAPGIAEPALAVRCTRVAAVTVLAFGIAGYLGAALRSVHVFGPPAAIYAAYNIGILATMAALHRPLGVFSAAIGLAVGGALMVAVQVPSLRRHLGSATTSPVLLVALGAFVPVAVYTIAQQGQVFVERFIGSELGAGTISHLNYAQKVAQVPMVLSVMVATVTFPMLARSAITGDTAAARERTAWDLRVVAAIVLGCSAYLIAFAPIVVSVLFEHGLFTPADTAATAAIIRVYTLGLLGQAFVVTLTRVFFSAGRPNWFPALAMAIGLAATAGISVLLAPVWHAMGIAAGNAVGITLTAGLMLRAAPLEGRRYAVGRPVVAMVVSAALATGIGLAAAPVLTAALGAFGAAVIGAVVVGLAFVAASTLAGAEEPARMLRAVLRRRPRTGLERPENAV
jgi:putative peptidoglycan lipid II flippase